MSIKYMKLISSEEIVAEVREESADTYTLANPVSVMFSNDQLAFARWAPLQDQSIDYVVINKSIVAFCTEPAEPIVEQYGTMFSTIVAPTKKLIL